jgi:hypothetical protein
MAYQSMTPVKTPDGLTEPESTIEIQQVVCVLKEALNSFSRQPSTQRQDQIVIGHVTDKIALCEGHVMSIRIEAGDFAFDKLNSPIQHRLAQIESDVIRLASSECQPHQRREKKKLPTARYQGYLVIAAKSFRQRLSGDNAAKAATYD